MAKRRATKKEAATDAPQTVDELGRIEEESRTQALPEQKAVYSVAEKIRRRVHNLPDPTRAPIGWDEQKGFERVCGFSGSFLLMLRPKPILALDTCA